MLPTPTTTAWSIRKVFTGARRSRLSRYSQSPSKSGPNGSGPSACNNGCTSPGGCQSRQPNRRGSLKRSTRPPSSRRSTWSWGRGGVPAGRTRRLPDMPRCSRALPAAVSSNRYFARRRTPAIRWPGRRDPTSPAIGQRRSGRRSVTASTSRPDRCGSRPARVVSTSGNSGMAHSLRAHPCKQLNDFPAVTVPASRGWHHAGLTRFSSREPRVPMPASLLDFLSGGLLQAGFGWLALYSLFATQLTIFSVILFLHRSMTHRGVDFHPVLNHFFRFWLWLTTSMITREWVAIHRKHHATCETEEDPHSPQTRGIKTVFWRGVELYREARADRASIEKYGKGCPDDAIERHLYTPHATMGPVLLLVLSFTLFGFAGVAMWALQMAWIPFWAAGV